MQIWLALCYLDVDKIELFQVTHPNVTSSPKKSHVGRAFSNDPNQRWPTNVIIVFLGAFSSPSWYFKMSSNFFPHISLVKLDDLSTSICLHSNQMIQTEIFCTRWPWRFASCRFPQKSKRSILGGARVCVLSCSLLLSLWNPPKTPLRRRLPQPVWKFPHSRLGFPSRFRALCSFWPAWHRFSDEK